MNLLIVMMYKASGINRTHLLPFCRARILTPNTMYPFLQVQALVELALCKSRPTLISAFARGVTSAPWEVMLFPFFQHRKKGKLFFLIWVNTNWFTFATTQKLLLKTQTKIDVDCVYKSRVGPRTSSPKLTFPLHLKRVRF